MTKKKTVRKETSKTDTQPLGGDTREQMYKELTANSADQPVYAITREEAPMALRSFLPDYRYRFEGVQAHSGDAFLGEFEKFLEANAYLVMDDAPSRAFADGFARAAAVAALYMDSLDIAP